MWAARPHLGSIFEKLLHRKTFQLPAARILQQPHIFLFPLLSLVFVKRWIISFTISYYTPYNTICQPTIVPNFHRFFCAECTRSPTQSTTMFFFTIHFPFCWRFFIEIHKTITKKSKKKKAFRWKIRYHENWGRWHTCQRKKVQTT